MLVSVGENLWTVEGPPVNDQNGLTLPMRMCIARLPSGGLWVHSPIRLTDPLRGEIAALGPVRHLVAPNDLQNTYLPAWSAAFPSAHVQAVAGVQRDCPFVAVDETLGAEPPELWEDQFEQVVFEGNLITTEAVFFHKPSGTVIFADLLQQLPRDWFSGWRRVVARIDRITDHTPAVPRKYRLAFRDRTALRSALSRVQLWPVDRIVMAHGPVVAQNGRKVLAQAFAWAA